MTRKNVIKKLKKLNNYSVKFIEPKKTVYCVVFIEESFRGVYYDVVGIFEKKEDAEKSRVKYLKLHKFPKGTDVNNFDILEREIT